MAGRKPVHKFNTLRIGQSTEVVDVARDYVSQYVYQFNKSGARNRDGKRIEYFEENGKKFIKRVA